MFYTREKKLLPFVKLLTVAVLGSATRASAENFPGEGGNDKKRPKISEKYQK